MSRPAAPPRRSSSSPCWPARPRRASSAAGPSGFDAWLGRGDPDARRGPLPRRRGARPFRPVAAPRRGHAGRARRSTTTPRPPRSSPLVPAAPAPPAHARRAAPSRGALARLAARRRPGGRRALRGAPGRAAARAWPPTGPGWSAPPSPRCAAPSRTAARLRGQNGVADAWTLAGPFGAFHALDLDRPFPPEQGAWPPAGARPLPAPDGALSLDGESAPGDVWYVAADASAGARRALPARASGPPRRSGSSWTGGRWRSGAPGRAGRRRSSSWRSTSAPGAHRFLVKLTRGGGRANLAVSLARDDGAPADVTWKAGHRARTGGGDGRASPDRSSPRGRSPTCSSRREGRRWPGSWRRATGSRTTGRRRSSCSTRPRGSPRPPRRSGRPAGDALAGDPTLAERTARARAEADWREASRIDPGDSATRLVLADVAHVGGAARRRRGAPGRASGEGGGAAAGPAWRGRACSPRGASRRRRRAWCSRPRGRGAAARRPRSPRWPRGATRSRSRTRRPLALGRCPGGVERLAEHRRMRGDLAGRRRGLDRDRARRPGPDRRPHGAGPRPRRPGKPGRRRRRGRGPGPDLAGRRPLQRRLGELLELSGQPVAARAARERALALDGSDLGLRRALALEDGREVLADLAVDGPATIRAYEAAAGPGHHAGLAGARRRRRGGLARRVHHRADPPGDPRPRRARGGEVGRGRAPGRGDPAQARDPQARRPDPRAGGARRRQANPVGGRARAGRLPGGGVAALPPDPAAGLARAGSPTRSSSAARTSPSSSPPTRWPLRPARCSSTRRTCRRRRWSARAAGT